MVTVSDMYTVSAAASTKLLSDYASDFWAGYRTNYEHFDKIFKRLYKTFGYFLQDDDQTAEEVQADFTEDVYNVLLMHDKEFSELYRVQSLADNAYDIVNNYDMTETMDRDMTAGSQTNDITNKVSPYDSSTFSNESGVSTTSGSRSDTENYKLTRKGNIGVMTATDIIEKHVDFWKDWDFYSYIFGVICKELLKVGDDE